MTVPLSSQWESFVARQVEAGRFSSARDVIEAGLVMMEQREAKLAELRATIEASLAEGGEFTVDEVERGVERMLQELRSPSSSSHREAKLMALRGTLDASVARGGENDEAAVQRRLDETEKALRAQGL